MWPKKMKQYKKLKRQKFNPTAITTLLTDISDHMLSYEDWERLKNLDYLDDEVLLNIFVEFSKPAYKEISENDKNEVKLALKEAIEDPHYDYTLIWGMLSFPFAFSDEIEDPIRFIKILWKALFD